MNLVRVEAEYGHCYTNALKFVVANQALWDSHKIHYVQGVVLSTETYERIGHCWVELTDPETGEEYAYEAVPHALVPRNTYYKRGDVASVHRYEPERAIRVAVSQGCGPWTEDVREGLHCNEVAAPKTDQELVTSARTQGTIPFEVD